MNECDRFEMFFSSYIEGELHSEKKRDLEAHLAVCSRCSEAVYRMKIIRDSLRRLPQIRTSEGFEHRLHYRITQMNESRQSPWLYFRENWKIPAISSVIALAVISFVLILSPLTQTPSTSVPQSVPASINPVPSAAGSAVLPTSKSIADPAASEQIPGTVTTDSTKSSPKKPTTQAVKLVGEN